MTGAAQPGVPFRDALRFWLKLGFISFGGPAGQIAVMHQELVERRRWISERRFLHALNYCMLLPGPEAQQLATYIGWLMHRTRGGIVAGALFVLPSFVILVLLSWLYVAYGDTPLVAGLFYGIKPAVTAIVLHAAHRIGSRTLRHPLTWTIAIAAFLAIAVLRLPFPLVIVAAAIIGFLGSRRWPGAFESRSGHAASAGPALRPAVIDDDSPTPSHARPSRRHYWRLAAATIGLWLAPLAVLLAINGKDGVLTQMGWFFTKAALLTFGGAYAVLPYVYQGAVDLHGWLTPAQMIDGLALGETTPGPLIMVVVFVGFLGGHGSQLFGADHAVLAGVVAATVVCWFTFLPSFLFVLGGGPLVESTRGNLRLTAPLAAITAAVVGVILSLALFFARQVFWPEGIAGRFDWISLAIALVALVALVRFKRSTIEVIVASGAAGLLYSLLLTGT